MFKEILTDKKISRGKALGILVGIGTGLSAACILPRFIQSGSEADCELMPTYDDMLACTEVVDKATLPFDAMLEDVEGFDICLTSKSMMQTSLKRAMEDRTVIHIGDIDITGAFVMTKDPITDPINQLDIPVDIVIPPFEDTQAWKGMFLEMCVLSFTKQIEGETTDTYKRFIEEGVARYCNWLYVGKTDQEIDTYTEALQTQFGVNIYRLALDIEREIPDAEHPDPLLEMNTWPYLYTHCMKNLIVYTKAIIEENMAAGEEKDARLAHLNQLRDQYLILGDYEYGFMTDSQREKVGSILMRDYVAPDLLVGEKCYLV